MSKIVKYEVVGLLIHVLSNVKYFLNGTPTYVDKKHPKVLSGVVQGKARYARIIIKKI